MVKPNSEVVLTARESIKNQFLLKSQLPSCGYWQLTQLFLHHIQAYFDKENTWDWYLQSIKLAVSIYRDLIGYFGYCYGLWSLVQRGECIYFEQDGTEKIGRWSEIRGGCFSKVLNALYLLQLQSGACDLISPERSVASQSGRFTVQPTFSDLINLLIFFSCIIHQPVELPLIMQQLKIFLSLPTQLVCGEVEKAS